MTIPNPTFDFNKPLQRVDLEPIMDQETAQALFNRFGLITGSNTYRERDFRYVIGAAIIDMPKTVQSGKYRGKLGVRINNAIHQNMSDVTEAEAKRVTELINFIGNNFPNNRSYYAEVINHLNWSDGQFGDRDSCFFRETSSRRHHWKALTHFCGIGLAGAVRVYRDAEGTQGFARCLLATHLVGDVPHLVQFNAYGLPSNVMAEITSALMGFKLKPRGSTVFTELYINRKHYLNDTAANSVYSTCNKNDRIDLSYIRPNAFSSQRHRCYECDRTFNMENLTETEGNGLVCSTCLNSHYYVCGRCANWRRNDYTTLPNGDQARRHPFRVSNDGIGPELVSMGLATDHVNICHQCVSEINGGADPMIVTREAYDAAYAATYASCCACGYSDIREAMRVDADSNIYCGGCYRNSVCSTCNRAHSRCSCVNTTFAHAIDWLANKYGRIGFELQPITFISFGTFERTGNHQIEAVGYQMNESLSIAFTKGDRNYIRCYAIVDGVALKNWSVDATNEVRFNNYCLTLIDKLVMPWQLPAMITGEVKFGDETREKLLQFPGRNSWVRELPAYAKAISSLTSLRI